MSENTKTERFLLEPPFTHVSGKCWSATAPSHAWFSDSSNTPIRSPLRIVEDDVFLGPEHSVHSGIYETGAGAYSHWLDSIYFSTSDGSDPNTNGRTYMYQIPRMPFAKIGAAVRRLILPRCLRPENCPLVTPHLLTVAKTLLSMTAPKTSLNDEEAKLFENTVAWSKANLTGSIIKSIDAIALYRLLKIYLRPRMNVLFQAVNNARFENYVLDAVGVSDLKVDVNDLKVNFDFDENLLRQKTWCRNIFFGSFDETTNYGLQYDLIICNSGYDNTIDIENTLRAQKEALTENGKLLFNVSKKNRDRGFMRLNKFYSAICFSKLDFNTFKNAEEARLQGIVFDVNEAVSVAERAGYEVLETVTYYKGFLALVLNMCVLPVLIKYWDELYHSTSPTKVNHIAESFMAWWLKAGKRHVFSQLSESEETSLADGRFYLVLAKRK